MICKMSETPLASDYSSSLTDAVKATTTTSSSSPPSAHPPPPPPLRVPPPTTSVVETESQVKSPPRHPISDLPLRVPLASAANSRESPVKSPPIPTFSDIRADLSKLDEKSSESGRTDVQNRRRQAATVQQLQQQQQHRTKAGPEVTAKPETVTMTSIATVPFSAYASRNSCKTLKCPKCNWHYKVSP